MKEQTQPEALMVMIDQYTEAYKALTGAVEVMPQPHLSILESRVADIRNRIETIVCAPSPSIPDDCPHVIWFADAELAPVLFAGHEARSCALHAWEKISQQWNAHLFVRVATNSRDATPQAANKIRKNHGSKENHLR